jgi:uncharacterized membrane protein (UPF0182 family)
MFDEFMEELRRRQAELEGREPSPPDDDPSGRKDGDAETDSEDEPSGDDRTRAEGDGAQEEGAEAGADAAGADDEGAQGGMGSVDGDDETAEGPADEPEPLDARRRRRGRGRGYRGPGGPGGRPPRPPRVEGEGPSARRLVLWTLLGVIVFGAILLIGPGVDFITDAMWFKSVGYDQVFWTQVGTQAFLFLATLAVALVFLLGNLWIAGRLTPPPAEGGNRIGGLFERLGAAARDTTQSRGPWEGSGPFGNVGRPGGPRPIVIEAQEIPDLTPLAGVLLAVFAVIIALGVAGAASTAWETFLLWRNQVPFAATGVPRVDPVFGRDISFFLFELPFLRLVQSLANGLILGALVLAGGRYLVGALRGGVAFSTPIRVHLAILGALYLISVAAGYQLDKFELVYSSNGVATGISYVDQHARFFSLDLLTIIAALAAALLVGGAFTRMMWPLAGAVIVWVGAFVLVGTVYPAIVERFVVAPNPYANEQPYIQFNIDMTRLAYGLDLWTSAPYGGDQPLTASALKDEADTFANARLWDYRPLGDTIDQLQTVRQYYDFADVDTDRYPINGQQRQVMLSARELDIAKGGITLNWLNERIIYTHGIGLVMTPVNEVTGQGQPLLWIRDLPPVESGGAPSVSQPRIYFGELTSDYIVTGARQNEFDYPSGQTSGAAGANDTGAEYRWTGTTGIKIDTTLTRLLFAVRFRDLNLLISDQITSESQLLFHRSLSDRLSRIAPFLKFDKDPYLVVTDGRLVYIQDAYTTSDKFPNAEPFSPGDLGQTNLGGAPIDYLRNSVKIVVDAYDGTTTLYVADPSDPIIRAYEGVFPGMFKPLSDMSADLRTHLRVPEEMFGVQTRMFGRYHVTNPLTFFQRDDVWTVPVGQTSEQSLPLEPYYVIMRPPGEPAAEFLLLQPMVPTSRPNMIAWVAARNDASHYGQIRYYQFPSNTSIFGPAQVEALIDQDPTISSQITLWNQSGSRVIRGNLLVVPVGDSILYLQPVYLQSTGSAFPEFQKIVVASPTDVVWANTLDDALAQILVAGGGTPSPSPNPSPGVTPSPQPSASPGTSPSPTDVQGLVAYANAHFELAQQALRTGDFATYGAEMKKVQAALEQLGQLVGTPPPSPAPSLAPSPAVSPSP